MSQRIKPSLVRGPASHYEARDQRIVEFSQGGSGGLISIQRNGAGQLVVELYRLDADVIVRAAEANLDLREIGHA